MSQLSHPAWFLPLDEMIWSTDGNDFEPPRGHNESGAGKARIQVVAVIDRPAVNFYRCMI